MEHWTDNIKRLEDDIASLQQAVSLLAGRLGADLMCMKADSRTHVYLKDRKEPKE